MKILKEKYPKGTLKGQQSDGRYINENLKVNVDTLAKHIIKDMTWLAVIYSSTLEVGTGKSVFAQQLAEAYLDSVNNQHNKNIDLSMTNIVFRPKDIIERSFKVPRYSVIICDEWEDAHYWSELGTTLRQFFRKCRQLNLFMIVIIPNFFQLPITYAVSRSIFAIDVKFSGDFQRGHFSFYSFQRKKDLYVKGKKNQNYHIVKANFHGRFADGYVVPEEEYREKKAQDLEEQENQKNKVSNQPTTTQVKAHYYRKLRAGLPLTSVKQIQEILDIPKSTGTRWLHQSEISEKSQNPDSAQGPELITNSTQEVVLATTPEINPI